MIETKDNTKILILDVESVFAWISVKEIGEILVTSHKTHIAEAILAIGKYRLYDVKDEPKLSDQLHIELSLGEGLWQGYLLPTGLPTSKDKRNRIIPTSEVISKANSTCESCQCQE